jgi:hypothetical protein
VKSSVAAAKAKVAAQSASDTTVQVFGVALPTTFPIEVEPAERDSGWLYVMRCPLMDADVYKVGWSSRPAAERAEELSSATGIPMAYVVVESWAVTEARRAEREAHLALQEYRINPKREFFRAPYERIRASIEPVIVRICGSVTAAS